MLPILTSVLVLILSLVLAWAGRFLGLSGTPLVIFRILAVALGLTAAIIILLIYIRERRRDAATGTLPGGSELNDLLRDVERRIATAQRTGPRSLATLPLLYILGDANTSKTTTVLKSGLDPELIAGQIYRDQDVVPTPVANFWFTRAAVLVEAGNAVRSTPALWDKLIRRTRPKAIRSAVGQQTPVRAAVVCVSSEQFLGATASDASLASARSLNQMLRELALQLGTEVPVYVILTKLDRIPNFSEFVRNLTNEEATEPFGIPFSRAEFSSGLYAEKAMAQVTGVLDQLVFSLGEFRLQLLTRETEQRNIDPVYEFPRELRKLRNNLAAFLVELVRPSHLNFNPWLRGLYFTGVRAQVVEQMVAVAAQAPQAAPVDAGATRMFSIEQMRAAQAQQAPQTVAQKVAQWCFLPRLLPSVILQDRSALAVTTNSGRTHVFRRVTFALLSLFLLALLACFTLSWMNNNDLEQSILSATRAIPTHALQSGTLASEEDLNALDHLRTALVQLEDYKENGVPFRYGFWLYPGNRMLDPARGIYFAGFRRLLLEPTQGNLAQFLGRLPSASKQGDDYSAAYNPLRAYLITTINPDKSTSDFLSPVLLQFWLAGRSPQTDQQGKLARAQFDFYATELARSDPYPLTPNMPDLAVTQARTYLNTFGGEDRIYQQMLAIAGSGSHGVNFNVDYPGSAMTVTDGHPVPAAFTKNAFPLMQSALANPKKYFSGERWVLGDQASGSLDPATVTQHLTTRYEQDYIAHWQAFLRTAQVVSYRGLGDASTKLQMLEMPNSSLLALLYTASHNTSVADTQIAKPFQPTQAVVAPDATDKFIGPGNQPYISGLGTLQQAVTQAAQAPPDPNNPALAALSTAASTAHGVVLQTAQAFNSDSAEMPYVVAFLQAPIKGVDELIRAQGPKVANGAGQNFCIAYSKLVTKFPFAPNGADATIPEVDAVLNPASGAIVKLNEAAKPILAAPPGAPVTATRDFIQFYNRLQTLSTILYPANPAAGGANFTVQILPSPGIQTVSFQLDKQVVSTTGTLRTFTWSPQNSQQAQITAGAIPPLTFSGNWALLHLLANGQRQPSSTAIRLDYPLGFAAASKTVVRIELSSGATDLLPGQFAPTRCVATVAH